MQIILDQDSQQASQPKLSILIPTLPRRSHLLARLLAQIEDQIKRIGLHDPAPNQVEIITDENEDITIGIKRNEMLQDATGEFVVFIDDDDRISDSYLLNIWLGITTPGITHCSLIGEIHFIDLGGHKKPFIHSTDYKEYSEDSHAYYRYPNHLNCIRADIAKQFQFPDWKASEDTNWATQLNKSRLLTNEYKINECIYYYDFINDKRKNGL